MKVSIIIPVYNVADYIENCLRSVQEQTYRDFEVILVDDCGTDESMPLAESYLIQHTSLEAKIVRHTHNRGLSAARNTGLQAATGNYVYFLDSDDSLLDDTIALMVAPLTEHKYDFVIAGYKVVGSDEAYPPLTLPSGALRSNKEILHLYAEGRWYMMAWNKLCNRKFLLDNKLFFEEGLLHEDVIWSFKLACKARSMYVIQEPTYRYTIRAASIMTGTDIERDANQYIKVFKVITQFVVNEGRQQAQDEYALLEGRKSALLFSLLQRDEYGLYNRYYPYLHEMSPISPWVAFKNKTIGIKYLLRDLHYMLPVVWGRQYKRLFYNLYYKWRGKLIEGALW